MSNENEDLQTQQDIESNYSNSRKIMEGIQKMSQDFAKMTEI